MNPISGSRALPCGRIEMTKPVVAIRTFENASKMGSFLHVHYKGMWLSRCIVPLIICGLNGDK